MNNELESVPVRCGCGGQAEIFHIAPDEGYEGSYCVRCSECLTQTPFFSKDKEKAITAWNTAMGNKERTAKVKDLERRGVTSISWEGTCTECGSYTMHDMNYCFYCGCRLEWE